jgi:glycosyltransferase involved in cell wall biosynthesis
VKKTVLFIGGPDVNTRIPLMQCLNDFEIIALGSLKELKDEFAKAGFKFFLYTLDRGTNVFVDTYTIFSLMRLFRLLQPDIVHTFDTKPGVLGRIAAKLSGVPVIIGTLPGLGGLYTNNSLPTRVKRKIYQPLQTLACRISDLTIFQNRDDLLQFVDAKIARRENSQIILGSGVKTAFFDPDTITNQQYQSIRDEFGVPTKGLLITMITRLIRSKGVKEFSNAAKLIKKKYPNVVFVLVGPRDRDSRDSLVDEELTFIKDHIFWAGVRSDIVSILAASDVLVLPSFYREGIPRVLLEAASMRLPIITTNSPGCREVVENGKNGYLIPARNVEALVDAIASLIKNRKLRESFGFESRKLAIARFDLSVIANQIENIYLDLLNVR